MTFCGLSVGLRVGHDREPCKNGRTDRDADGERGPKERCVANTMDLAGAAVRTIATITVAMRCFGCYC